MTTMMRKDIRIPRKDLLIPAELHEARLLIEALCKFRRGEHPSWGDHEIDNMIRRVMSHIGFPTAKTIVPEVYAEYYPDGPPKIRPWW